MVEAEGEDGVARIEEAEVDGHVGVGAGVGLDVGVLGAEEGLGPLARQRLDLVDDGVAAVEALAGVALGVLVGEDRAGRAQDRRRGEVLAGDELEGGLLPLELAVDEAEHLVVGAVVGRPGHPIEPTGPARRPPPGGRPRGCRPARGAGPAASGPPGPRAGGRVEAGSVGVRQAGSGVRRGRGRRGQETWGRRPVLTDHGGRSCDYSSFSYYVTPRGAPVASSQHGVITADQATLAGLTSHQVRHLVDSGRWERRGPRVFTVAGAPQTFEQDVLVACLLARRARRRVAPVRGEAPRPRVRRCRSRDHDPTWRVGPAPSAPA